MKSINIFNEWFLVFVLFCFCLIVLDLLGVFRFFCCVFGGFLLGCIFFFFKHMPVSRISSYNWEENSVLMLKSFLNLCSSGNIVNSSYISGHYRKCEARVCKINKKKGKDKQADNHGL